MVPHELAHELELIYGNDLKAVVLYGSAAGGEHSAKYSDYNIFCVLAKPTPAMLSKANRVVRKWIKKGNPPPLFFDPEHIERSLDVFPIEFLDILGRHEVILGADPLAGINIDPKNLRHECESELKGKLLHLRTFYTANCHDPKTIAKMMVESFPTFLASFRAILRLINEKVPQDSKAVIERVASVTGINPAVFLEIAEIRQGEGLLPRKMEALSAFERYLTEIEAITIFVDEMQT